METDAKATAPTLAIRAKVDFAFIHSGLFLSLPPGSRKPRTFSYESKSKSVDLTFICAEALGAEDARILTGACAIGTEQATNIKGWPPGIAVSSARRLGLEAGMSNAAASTRSDQIKGTLTRLASVLVRDNKTGETLPLLTWIIQADGQIRITLHPRQAKVIGAGRWMVKKAAPKAKTEGKEGEQVKKEKVIRGFLNVDMRRARQLQSNVSFLLFLRLHYVNASTKKRPRSQIKLVTPQKMSEFIWGTDPVSLSAKSNRKRSLFAAVKDLQDLGWTFASYSEKTDSYIVERPEDYRRAQPAPKAIKLQKKVQQAQVAAPSVTLAAPTLAPVQPPAPAPRPRALPIIPFVAAQTISTPRPAPLRVRALQLAPRSARRSFSLTGIAQVFAEGAPWSMGATGSHLCLLH